MIPGYLKRTNELSRPYQLVDMCVVARASVMQEEKNNYYIV